MVKLMYSFKNYIEINSPSFGPSEVCHIAMVRKKDLSNWTARGHFEPQIEAYTAGGGKRLYTAANAVRLATMKVFADNGLPLEECKVASFVAEERLRYWIDGNMDGFHIDKSLYLAAYQDPDNPNSDYSLKPIFLKSLTDVIGPSCAHVINLDMFILMQIMRIALYTGKMRDDEMDDDLQETIAQLRGIDQLETEIARQDKQDSL